MVTKKEEMLIAPTCELLFVSMPGPQRKDEDTSSLAKFRCQGYTVVAVYLVIVIA